MRAINLFTYTRINNDLSTIFENVLVQRSKRLKVKKHEFDTLVTLVNRLLESGASPDAFDNFFVSYTIEQIGKEFDLLKISENNQVLNIELKSDDVGEENIQKQLRKNRYYLKHIAPNLRLFTFVGSTGALYEYTESEFKESNFSELSMLVSSFGDSIQEGIEHFFKANNYLISPLNTPEKFLADDYFLTNNQKEVKDKIMEAVSKRNTEFILGITGKAGTGKTLLLYDIIREIAGTGGKCCVIHSGILCDGHKYLNRHWDNVHIIPAKELNNKENNILDNYDYFFIDESQRIYTSALKKIIKEVREKNKISIFAYDFEQSLSKAENRRRIPEKLKQQESFVEYKLSDRIRTSREIASFCRNLMNLNQKARGYMDYSSIEVLYAKDSEEAMKLIQLYKRKEYVFINYTTSIYVPNTIDLYPSEYDTHHVIGQEFDSVMIIMGMSFKYDEEGRIQGKRHPNPDYLFYKLLYQAISRARNKLCILVVENYKLFGQILGIKSDMLSRYQYKENRTNQTLSLKKMNRLSKIVKESIASDLMTNAVAISEAVDMINDELTGADLHKKVINSGIKLLSIIKNDTASEAKKAIEEYCDYVKEVINNSLDK